MWIRRLCLQGFGRFNRGVEMTFGEGVNVILGPNESGKSTIMESLVGILFGLEDRGQESSFRPRGLHSAFAGTLEIADGESEYVLSRDFETHHVALTRRCGGQVSILFQGEANPRGRTDELLAYLKVASALTGIKDRDMALRTLFMRQGDLETAVDESVRQMLSGARVGDYDCVIERLEGRFSELTQENPWGARRRRPREIEELKARIDELSGRLGRAREVMAHGGHLTQDLEETQRDRAAALAEVQEKAALFENFTEFFRLNNERDDLERQLRRLREEKEKVKQFASDCRRVEAELWPRFDRYKAVDPEFGEVLRSAANLQREIGSMEEDLARREAELTSTPYPRNVRRGVIVGAAAGLVCFLAMAGAGVWLIGIFAGLVLGAASFAGMVFLGKGKERARIRLEGQVVEIEERLERQKTSAAHVLDQIKPILGDRRLNQVMEEYREFREKADLLARYEQIRDSHRSLPDVEEEYDGVFNRLKLTDARARELIAESPYLAGADESLEKTARQLEKIRRDKEEAEDRLAHLEGVHDELKMRRARQESAPVDDIESIEEELAHCRERKSALEEARDALQTAVDVLRESVAEFQESHLERLASKASSLLKHVTQGRYERLALDRSCGPSVHALGGEVFSPGELSLGARDQLHLALRIALAEEIQAGRKLPLLMDDVLVNCDDQRLSHVRALIEEIASSGRQVLLFTHDPGYAVWSSTILTLTDQEIGEGDSLEIRRA